MIANIVRKFAATNSVTKLRKRLKTLHRGAGKHCIRSVTHIQSLIRDVFKHISYTEYQSNIPSTSTIRLLGTKIHAVHTMNYTLPCTEQRFQLQRRIANRIQEGITLPLGIQDRLVCCKKAPSAVQVPGTCEMYRNWQCPEVA